MADFQNGLISRIFGVFSDHFAKAIAFAWAIAFARWPIFKIILFLEYLVFFGAVFCTEQLQRFCRMVFRMFLAFLIFDPN